jgi:ABC-type sugar transport system, auxiliary component
MNSEAIADARERTIEYLDRAGITLTAAEREAIEIVDYGFDQLGTVGTEIVVYVNTDRYCAKELVLFPEQVCPEHRHPPVEELDYEGKRETFRCRWGRVFLYVETDEADDPAAEKMDLTVDPPFRAQHYTATTEIELQPGDQYTIPENTRHWFAAGPEGAVVSEFSSMSVDEHDVFTDPAVDRASTY